MASNIIDVQRQLVSLKQGVLSGEAFAKHHAEEARKAIASLEAKQGVYPRQTVVDGRRGAAEEQVKPGGVIEYHISPVDDVLDAIFEEIVRGSPVGEGKGGHYKDNHKLFINLMPREVGQGGAPIILQPGDEAVLINLLPYARKIEGARGRGGYVRPGLSAQAPDGVYEITAKVMARRFSNYPVKIEYDFRAFVGGNLLVPAPALSEQRKRKMKGGFIQNKSENRFPCIVVTVDKL